ncbi:MAG: type II toxin-antitoxin system HicB family antitoxin [Candidatus Sabulitectum sp.]|nr:type II toxin-antitoxin system HicB family antitoxin [Candidatus Sabulitectum sp.]
MFVKVVLEPSDEGGFTVIVPTLPGCISEGDSKEETLNNIREAIELYLEPLSV